MEQSLLPGPPQRAWERPCGNGAQHSLGRPHLHVLHGAGKHITFLKPATEESAARDAETAPKVGTEELGYK